MPDKRIINPVLRGFHPDPSICRVGRDFYIATSTFEWYPGVRIHHSRDLREWRLIARPLDSDRLLNLLGVPDSCGVWAPCLTWADGVFWLAYTVVNRFNGNFKDTHNYLTTAPEITGPWSDPVYLNSSGFDPSLYHAEDGRKWFLNMVWDHRPGRGFFHGIAMQEYDARQQRLSGKPERIFTGTELGYTEGPHIHRFGDFHYLLTAEGGTGYGHAVTVARSPSPHGPYEPDPNGPLLTTRDRPDWPLQRAGHGDLVQLENGGIYIVFLCSRRSATLPHSPLGRETAIQPVHLTADGWLRLPWSKSRDSRDRLPRMEIAAPRLSGAGERPGAAKAASEIEHDDFDGDTLDPVYQWLRTPWPERFLSLSERPGHLRLYGMESPGSLYTQALIARRQTHLRFTAETAVDFQPANFQQIAGLIVYYNASKFHYLCISHDEALGRHLGIMSCQANFDLDASFPIEEAKIALPGASVVGLRLEIDHAELRFSWSIGGEWHAIPVTLDMRLLTDQAGKTEGEQFTGTFVGLCANDVGGGRAHADFDYFRIRGVDV
ncbi:MAG: glycoside hydrolase family 43 protein [Gammaproteobacteria bacterium]|nr:glycoside hydrolase family 43 protein [Gammaproteobacteria bacterium]